MVEDKFIMPPLQEWCWWKFNRIGLKWRCQPTPEWEQDWEWPREYLTLVELYTDIQFDPSHFPWELDNVLWRVTREKERTSHLWWWWELPIYETELCTGNG